MIELGQRLPHPQRCESGLWALVPALLHDLHYGCQDLQDTMADVKTLPGQKEAPNTCSILLLSFVKNTIFSRKKSVELMNVQKSVVKVTRGMPGFEKVKENPRHSSGKR